MEQSLKAHKENPVTEVCFEPAQVKSLKVLTAEELNKRGLEPEQKGDTWIQVTLVSKYGDDVLETLFFPGSDWVVEFG